MKKLLLTTAAAVAFIVPAQAADLPVKAPPAVVPVLYNWGGCYVGVAGGWAWGRSTHDLVAPATDTGPFNVDGGIVGGTAGCNFAPGRFLFGIEADGSWVGKDGEAPNPATPNFISETRERWLVTVRGRIGPTFDRLLLYVTGGAAWADIHARSTNTLTAVSIAESATRFGWTIGGGVEYGLAPNISVKAEYLFVDFQDRAYFTPPPAAGFTARDNVDLHNHIFRVGVNWRFGGPVVARF